MYGIEKYDSEKMASIFSFLKINSWILIISNEFYWLIGGWVFEQNEFNEF